MKTNLTNIQMQTISNCNNDYLKMLYTCDFLFDRERTKESLFAILKETNRTKNINVKMFYLYLTCKFNLKHMGPFLDNEFEFNLNAREKKEVDEMRFINVYSYNPKPDEIELNEDVKPKNRKEKIKNKRRENYGKY